MISFGALIVAIMSNQNKK
ncbi:hypothetical protein [Scopulibacillus cellulosilyticus]|uniref:Uncharacterized protein n=1 Tax=Scopulibacillus cellulosilyticus TaxID=2665665 RepID=A0ABW2Q3C8_9BACL